MTCRDPKFTFFLVHIWCTLLVIISDIFAHYFYIGASLMMRSYLPFSTVLSHEFVFFIIHRDKLAILPYWYGCTTVNYLNCELYCVIYYSNVLSVVCDLCLCFMLKVCCLKTAIIYQIVSIYMINSNFAHKYDLYFLMCLVKCLFGISYYLFTSTIYLPRYYG